MRYPVPGRPRDRWIQVQEADIDGRTVAESVAKARFAQHAAAGRLEVR